MPRRRPSSITQPTMWSTSVGRLRTARSRHGPDLTFTCERVESAKRSSTARASASSAGVRGRIFSGSNAPKLSSFTPAASAAPTPSPTRATSSGW